MATEAPTRIGIVGYGTGGRHFHAPFIAAAEGVEVAGVVTRSPERRALVEAEVPGARVFDSLSAMIDAGVDAVTITTPPETRRELVLEAIGRGVPAVGDKPFAPSAAGARELAAAAADAGVLLTVFHNRRWDADVRTVKAVLDGGGVGELWRVHSRFDLDDPVTFEMGPTGGLLRDLGSHVVDQMLWLLGPAERVHARLDHIGDGADRTDAGFVISIDHVSGVRSFISSSKLNGMQVREFRLYGSRGGYEASGTDVQAQAIFAGRRPADEGDRWGYDDESRWGHLHSDGRTSIVPSERGAYQDFYTSWGRAVRGEADVPVSLDSAIETLAVLDAARESDATGSVVRLR